MTVCIPHCIGSQHQPWKIKSKLESYLLLPGAIRAVDHTKFALKALVYDVVLLGRGHLPGIARATLACVVKHGRKGRTKIHTLATAITHVKHPRQLHSGLGFIEIHRMMRVVRGGHELRQDRNEIR
jgi:hypothetical protein